MSFSWHDHLTATALRRKPSPISALLPLVSIPGMISLGSGMPNPTFFPFTSFSMGIADGGTLQLSTAEVAEALQYSAARGLPELCQRLMRLQTVEHSLGDRAGPIGLTVTPGSQDGLAKLFDALVGPGDSLLIEMPTHAGSLAYLQGIGCTLVGVPTDGSGLDPEALAAMLAAWDDRKAPKPRVLYTIPTGSNPTGVTLPLSRRHRLLEVAREHDLAIIEDDPYYFLSFAAERIPSLLSLDTDGRVVRCDSLSKILSSGIRIGFVTGPEPIIEAIVLHNQASIIHTSGLSQAAVLALLRHWHVGDPGAPPITGTGLATHLEAVRSFYRAQCVALIDSIKRHLTSESGDLLVEYSPPDAGMFVWLRLLGVPDSNALVSTHAVHARVLLVPGCSFFPPSHGPSDCVRAAFSIASPDNMDAAMLRLGGLLREMRREKPFAETAIGVATA